MDATKKRFEDFQLEAENKKVEMEKTINSRNHEIKLLMYRIQELSSKYVPCKGDPVDHVLAKWINGYRPAVPVFRVGGGYVDFERFLEKYAAEELEKLLVADPGTDVLSKSLVAGKDVSRDAR